MGLMPNASSPALSCVERAALFLLLHHLAAVWHLVDVSCLLGLPLLSPVPFMPSQFSGVEFGS